MMQTNLISRGAVIDRISEFLSPKGLDEWEVMVAIREIIENVPAIDAVPVVRCKDCKWWGLPEGMYATENIKHCEFGRYMVASDGYCVYGEVKSNESE